jgi:hypothetical protein
LKRDAHANKRNKDQFRGCHRLAALDTRKCEEPSRKTARNHRIAFLKMEKGTLEPFYHFHVTGT